MTNYTELKRLAEDCKNCGIDFDDVSPQQGSTSCDKLVRHYLAAASPDVTLEMIDALDVQAGSIEAVQAANQRLAAERDKLRTQNQALREAVTAVIEYDEINPHDGMGMMFAYADALAKCRATQADLF